MSRMHRALIVEDHAETADDLREILRSIGCDSVRVASHEEALAVLQRESICLVLLDLEIKHGRGSVKGHVEHGKALLRELRHRHSEHNGRGYWLPVLIISGFAREWSTAVDVMKDGASDVIRKPFSSPDVSDLVRRALDGSGRASHDACALGPARRAVAGIRVLLAIPGDRVRRRTVVMVGPNRVELTTGSLRVLLHLIVAHKAGRMVHKTDLGASLEQGFKGVSILRSEIKAALPMGVDIVANDYHGNYSLSPEVEIGPCATATLRGLGDATVSQLAAELDGLMGAPDPSGKV